MSKRRKTKDPKSINGVPIPGPGEIAFIQGKAKFGKTTLWRWIAFHLKISGSINFAIDPHGVTGDEMDFALRATRHEGDIRAKILESEVDRFIDCIPINSKKPVFLFIDEAQKWLRPNEENKSIKEVVDSGRNENIGIIVNTRKMKSASTSIRDSVNLVYCFHVKDQDVRKAMSRWLDADCEILKPLKKKEFEVFE